MAWWLMPRTPDPEVGGSSPTRVKPCCVLEQGTFTPQKVLVIPRKRWLRPNMTEKLFTGTLRINQPTKTHLGCPKYERDNSIVCYVICICNDIAAFCLIDCQGSIMCKFSIFLPVKSHEGIRFYFCTPVCGISIF